MCQRSTSLLMAEEIPGVKFVIEAATAVHIFRQSALFYCHFLMYQLRSSGLAVVSKPIMNNRRYFAFSSSSSSTGNSNDSSGGGDKTRKVYSENRYFPRPFIENVDF